MQRKRVVTCVLALLFAGTAAPAANAVAQIEPGPVQELPAVAETTSLLSTSDINTSSPSSTQKLTVSNLTPFAGEWSVPAGSSVTPAKASVHVFLPGEMAAYPTLVNGREFSGEAWRELSPRARADLFNKLGDLGRGASADRSLDRPDWYVNVGFKIYFHDLSPSDQRFFMQAGSGAIAGAICAATEGVACPWAGGIASGIAAAVGEYYHPTCWIAVAVSFTGNRICQNSELITAKEAVQA